MNQWKNQPSNIKDYHGFVYCIVNLTNNKKYIGKKCFWNKIKRKPLKGQKRIRRDVIESDWKNYWGSCKQLKEDIKQHGKDKFMRVILKCFHNKFDLAYQELKLQIDQEVLFRDDYYNNIIQVRLGGRGNAKKRN